MNILLLEDDNPLREVLKLILTTAEPGLTVHQFGDSDTALAHIQTRGSEIDLYVLDVRVPGTLDGLALARQIRDLGYDSPIVMTSAYRRLNQTVLGSLDCAWLPKPWQIMAAKEQILPLARQYDAARRSAPV